MKITKIEYSDAVAVGRMLKTSKSLTSTKVVKDVLDHISNGIALKFTDEDKILGVWCSMEFDTHVSLSFFYTDESIRRKPQLAVFFNNCLELINKDKPLMISTRDVTGFERYVEKVSDELYQFIGLR
jgi:hypothetical protein